MTSALAGVSCLGCRMAENCNEYKLKCRAVIRWHINCPLSGPGWTLNRNVYLTSLVEPWHHFIIVSLMLQLCSSTIITTRAVNVSCFEVNSDTARGVLVLVSGVWLDRSEMMTVWWLANNGAGDTPVTRDTWQSRGNKCYTALNICHGHGMVSVS